jgi:ribosomal protein S18 acetylase RimI-like enzyme
MSLSPLLRPATIEDHDQLIALWTSTGVAIPPGDSKSELKSKLETDPQLFLVLEQDGALIGSVMGSYDGRRGWVGRLCVHADHRGSGFGSSMLTAVEDGLRSLGCTKVNLLVEPANALAVTFYADHGYTEDELIFMEKWLT